jgi:hypothetical protein
MPNRLPPAAAGSVPADHAGQPGPSCSNQISVLHITADGVPVLVGQPASSDGIKPVSVAGWPVRPALPDRLAGRAPLDDADGIYDPDWYNDRLLLALKRHDVTALDRLPAALAG